MKSIQDQLRQLGEEEYAAFEAKLAPTLPREVFLGVRVPELRKLAAQLEKTERCGPFLAELPHETYDENLLHSVLLSRAKPYERTLALVEAFLPYVDNWAVCDTLRPKVFEKHKDELLPEVKRWIASEEPFTCRFGIDMLMTYYLDEAFDPALLELPCAVESGEYYVRMMVAWYYATALAKQWDAAIPYIEQRRLPAWTHAKTIQKARESFRITKEQKAYLQTLK